jgi:hypothetical protein
LRFASLADRQLCSQDQRNPTRPIKKIPCPRHEEPREQHPSKKSAVLKLSKKISARQQVIFKPADLHDFQIAAGIPYYCAALQLSTE